MAHETFREDPYVHGVACGLQERYDISDKVYSYLVYGLEVPVTKDGGIAEDMESAVAKMVIQEPMSPAGVPMPVVLPVRHEGDEPFTIGSSAENTHQGDFVAWYDDEENTARGGAVMDVEDDKAFVLRGQLEDEDAEVVTLETGGDFDEVTINGTSVEQTEFSMANNDDEHEKDWWRLDEFEEALGGDA